MNTQMIPIGKPYVYVDEPAEFSDLAKKTDLNRRKTADSIERELSEQHRRNREARRERRRLVENCKLLALGMVSACCAICAVQVFLASYHALAVFPAALSVIAICRGVCR